MDFGMKGALSRSSKERSRIGMADGVAEHGRIPLQIADVGPCIGVEQQLHRIEAMPRVGLVGPVHAIAIDLTGTKIRQPAVKNLVGVFRQCDAIEFGLAFRIEDADLDFRRIGRETARN